MQLNNKAYDILKWVCIVVIPAVNTFLGIVLPAVGVSANITTTTVTVIAALGTFIGSLIGVSCKAYNKEESK